MNNHIKDVYDDTTSVCGQLLGGEFYFKSIEAAILNGKHEGAVKACSNCTARLVNYLQKGSE